MGHLLSHLVGYLVGQLDHFFTYFSSPKGKESQINLKVLKLGLELGHCLGL
jgi:hypothetical protein